MDHPLCVSACLSRTRRGLGRGKLQREGQRHILGAMKTEALKLDGSSEDVTKIGYAARLLEAGGLVAFPTETVYGVGASAASREALESLSLLKARHEAIRREIEQIREDLENETEE